MKDNPFSKPFGRGPADPTDPTDRSDRTDRHRATRLRPSGGYRELRSFQAATIIYDATVSFCDRFIDKCSRTHDQMVQAARSGRQNIAEGCRAGATSGKTETRLTNVARSSLDELLLDRQIAALERNFIQKGGYSEQLAAVRIEERERKRVVSGPTDRATAKLPDCPLCGKRMTLRTARQGKNAGSRFWGCTTYPDCKGTRPLEEGKSGSNRPDMVGISDYERKS